MIDWESFKQQMQANPGNMLRYVLGITLCFLLIWVLVVVQTETAGDTVTVTREGRLDSLRLVLNRPPADSAESAGNTSSIISTPQGEPSESRRPTGGAWPTFMVLVVAVGGLWIWIKKRASQETATEQGSLFSHIGTQEVAAGHQISVVKINGEFWVLGTGTQGLTLLHRYSEEEWEGPEPDIQSRGSTAGGVFANLLERKQVPKQKAVNGSTK